MNNITKIFVPLALLCALYLTACGNSNRRNNADTSTTESTQATTKQSTEGSDFEQGDSLNPSNSIAKVGDIMPSFKVEMTDGSIINSDSLRGKVVWINFWATWCGPCRSELKRAKKDIIERLADDDFVFIPIGVQEESEHIKAFKAQKGYEFPMGSDPTGEIYGKFVSRMSIPRNFIIDRDGTILVHKRGYAPQALDDMIDRTEKIIKQKH